MHSADRVIWSERGYFPTAIGRRESVYDVVRVAVLTAKGRDRVTEGRMGVNNLCAHPVLGA
jgi:hypothetical protein